MNRTQNSIRMVLWTAIIVGCGLLTAGEVGVQNDYDMVRVDMGNQLRHKLLEAWFPRCVDKVHGGYWLGFDAKWRKIGSGSKMVVTQSRQLWVSAKSGKMFPEDPRYRAAADHGYVFLRDVMWDKEHGGFYWEVDKDGVPAGRFRTNKHVYGVSFAIYALSAYWQLSGNEEARELALKAFDWLEKHAHDRVNGGYFGFLTRAGGRILVPADNPLGAKQRFDMVGAYLGYKDMNTHIHLLESFTVLYEATREKRVRMRLEEMLDIVGRKIAMHPGTMHYFFHPDWRPVPDHDSYGHDVETAYLLIEALAVLERDDSDIRQIARELVDNPLRYGWDRKEGGFFYGGSTFGRIFDRDKQWWVMAEGMNALLLMHMTYGSDETDYWQKFVQNWQLFRNRFIDQDTGGVLASLNVKETEAKKGSNWKGCYHDGRALMNCSRMLAQLADRSKRSQADRK